MVEAATKGETLCNIRTGQMLLTEGSIENSIEMKSKLVGTKEYSHPGQEAYTIKFK